MTTKEALIAMRELLSDPKRWCKGSDARDARCHTEVVTSAKACSWCLRGAAQKVCGFDDGSWCRACEAIDVPNSIVGFNDAQETTHADILRVLDAAIEGA